MMAKAILGAAAAAGLIIVAAQARGGPDRRRETPVPAPPTVKWDELTLSLRGPARAAMPAADEPTAPDIDVVDAHWMALTMWGEARGQGEEAMRAVGHVIDNRRRAGRAQGPYVTDTVSEAWQFSCWNPGDPNRAAIERIDALARDSREYALWRAARRLADEILAGRSADPTGGALFYHAESVSPAWSRGIAPVMSIGGHLFFLTAR